MSKKAEIAPNTMAKLRRDEEVSLTILSKICKTLHADFGDIVEYVPDAEIWDLYNENREKNCLMQICLRIHWSTSLRKWTSSNYFYTSPF